MTTSQEAAAALPASSLPSWQAALALFTATWLAGMAATLVMTGQEPAPDLPRSDSADALWMALLHLPYAAILVFLLIGLVERLGYLVAGRLPAAPGTLSSQIPKVCIQLPMFNEHAVAERIIRAAAAIDWPRDRLEVQVLDDSTDPAVRRLVDAVCSDIRERTGLSCVAIHRTDRKGYKAGALEAGRRQTDAEFIAIFDADFLPSPDYLVQIMPHFFAADGSPESDLAMVQAQWGHLNDEQSFLTGAQAMWVDDHHTLQKSWRSAAIGFVNFTGTAGVWRASAIEAIGGWRSASLVEDCELSVRALFHGYRTKFVKEIVAPAELPQSLDAYRLQQKRWTQGWVQLQRMHLASLITKFRAPLLRKAYLGYLMCISWQWPLWFIWVTVFPFLIANSAWFGVYGMGPAVLIYLAPPMAFALFAGLLAALETRSTYDERPGNALLSRTRRFGRIVPYLVVNAGMLPHHVAAFIEGLFGPMHSEFERTPKTASVSDAAANRQMPGPAAARPKARVPYLAFETVFVATQAAWIAYFVFQGSFPSAVWASWLAACIIGLRIIPVITRYSQNSSLKKA